MIVLEDLTTNYGIIQALRNVSLEAPEGEVTCVLGANGAGKSTMILSILGLVKPSSGRVLLDGERIDRLKTHEIIQRGISWVPEGRRVFPKMTVQENLDIGGVNVKDKQVLQGYQDRCVEMFPVLKDRLTQKAGTLSGGEQQMLAISRALMAGPRVICMDEPSMGLAPILVDAVFEKIVDINREGMTVLLVEQNAEMALTIAHRGYVLVAGDLTLQGTAAELRADESVKKAYLGG